MSAAKMVADSTQGDLDEPKKKRKRKKENVKKKSKKLKKRDSRKGKYSKKEDDDSDLDLEKELQPIGDYIKERYEMNEELFHCLRGPTLQRYIPDVLKDLPLEELKKRCLEHLEIMSKKRIRGILAGDDPGTISSSGTEEDSSGEEQEEAPQEIDEGLIYDLDKGSGEEKGSDSDVDRESEGDEEKKSDRSGSEIDEEVNEDLEDGETVSNEDEDFTPEKYKNEREVSSETEGEITSDESGEDKEDTHQETGDHLDIDIKKNDQEESYQKEEEQEKIAKKDNIQDKKCTEEKQKQTNYEEDCRVRVKDEIPVDNDVNSDCKTKQEDVHRDENQEIEMRNDTKEDEGQNVWQEKKDKSEVNIASKEGEITEESSIQAVSTLQGNTIFKEFKNKKEATSSEMDIDIQADRLTNMVDDFYKYKKESPEQKNEILEKRDNLVKELKDEDVIYLGAENKYVLDNPSHEKGNRIHNVPKYLEEINDMEDVESCVATITEQVATSNVQQKSETRQDNQSERESAILTDKRKVEFSGTREISQTRSVVLSKTLEGTDSQLRTVSKFAKADPSKTFISVSSMPSVTPPIKSVMDRLGSQKIVSKEKVQVTSSSKVSLSELSAKTVSKVTAVASSEKQSFSKLRSKTSLSSTLSSKTISIKQSSVGMSSKTSSNIPSDQAIPSSSKSLSSKAKTSKTELSPNSDETLAPVLTKNQMELLELEMRARAIKAMLAAHEKKEKQLERQTKLGRQ